MRQCMVYVYVFFFNDTATTEIYTLSLHDALPIYGGWGRIGRWVGERLRRAGDLEHWAAFQADFQRVFEMVCEVADRSEEHTSELQSRQYLVCRLLLEKKKNK